MSKVKILSQKSEQSVKTEKNILSKINHPFIVNMFFSFQDNDNLYLIMDLLPGGDLRYHINHIKLSSFNEAQTKFFISNIIIALEYIHYQKIIHRDIKPENLLLDKNGYLHLTDFGIALINDKNNKNINETSGTEGYMAPEVILKQGHSYPADFFAIGVIGYELMLGHRPYSGNNRKQIKNAILSHQALIKFNKMRKGWSENSRDFINKLIQRRPIKRLGYSGIKELKNHIWFKGINWDLLKKKKIKAPYIPKEGKDYFDKKFCQEETTGEKYKHLIDINQCKYMFENYTFVNINYISKIDNSSLDSKKSINNDLNKLEVNIKNLKQSFSFSEKGKKFLSSHKIINNNKDFQHNKDYLNTPTISKTNKNNSLIKENNLFSYQTKIYSPNLTHQLYLNDKDKSQNINKSNITIKNKSKDNIIEINNNNIYKIKINKKLTKHSLSSNNIIKEKKHINLKDIHNLIVKNILNSPIYKNALEINSSNLSNELISNKSCRSTKSILIKSNTNTNHIINYKMAINNKEKEKEKNNIFNSTTKIQTSINKDTNRIKKVNSHLKIIDNYKRKYVKTNEINNPINENINLNKKINKEPLFHNLYLINSKNKNSIFSSRNKIIHKAKLCIKEDTLINYQDHKVNNTKYIYNKKQYYNSNINKDSYMSNLINNKNDYNIKVTHKKIFKITNNYDTNKNTFNLDSTYKNTSLNKNGLSSLINSKSNFNSYRYFSNFKTYKKYYEQKNNKIISSKIFHKFKKKIQKIKVKDIKHKSYSNLNIKKENKTVKNNNLNEANNKKELKCNDYFGNNEIKTNS